jgi:hypothetical protein
MEHVIISIGRQFGSGGRVIGKALAKALSVEYYDKELLLLAAKESGIAPEFFENTDEKSSNIFEHAIDWLNGNLWFNTDKLLSGDTLFQIQSDAIQKLASEKSCVIVGRCSDYILRNNPNCVSIFLHSSDKNRAECISKRMNVSYDEAISLMREEDKKRASYYNFYSDKTWGDSATYDISIDVSKLGEEQTMAFIISYLKMRFPSRF